VDDFESPRYEKTSFILKVGKEEDQKQERVGWVGKGRKRKKDQSTRISAQNGRGNVVAGGLGDAGAGGGGEGDVR